MKILITGSNGLLGQKLVKQLLKRNISFVATSKGENRNPDCPDTYYQQLDIVKREEVNSLLIRETPTHVIHTAAITNVDLCEEQADLCFEVNVLGTKNLFDKCVENNIHFQLLSTDFVFDGIEGNYAENDPVSPLSYYARSKVEAENLLMSSEFRNWSIVRTIIVYGNAHNLSRSNLFLWAKSALPEKQPMKVVDDQFRAPTWADDLAWGCIRICELDQKGVFHLSGPETISIYNIVERISNYYNWSMENVQRISSSMLNQPAQRPPKTGFDLSKARKLLGYNPKTIEQTLDLL